jgi:hypothetical protein
MAIIIKSNNLPLPSQKLKMMLVEANSAFGHAGETIRSAYNQAISEGFTQKEAGKLIRSNITWLSDRTLRLYLPDEAKDKKMQSLARRRPRQNCREIDEKLNRQDQIFPETFSRETRINIEPSPEFDIIPTISEEIRIGIDPDPDEITAMSSKEIKLPHIITNSDTAKILLNNKLAKIIHDGVNLNKKAEFELFHDGKYAISVTML